MTILDKSNLPPEITPRNNNYKKISNQKFGKLTALYPAAYINDGKRLAWLCQCDCGNYVLVPTSNLVRGLTQSCGCQKQSPLFTPTPQYTASRDKPLNLPYHYNLVYFVTPDFSIYKDYLNKSSNPIPSLVSWGICNSELYGEGDNSIAIEPYVFSFENYMEIDGVPFKDFTKSQEYTWNKEEQKAMENHIANDGWKADYIDAHTTYTLPQEEIEKIQNLKASQLTNELINEWVEKGLLVCRKTEEDVIDLCLKTKTKYYLYKRKENSCRIVKPHYVPAELCFSTYDEAYSCAAALYNRFLDNTKRNRVLMAKEAIEFALNQVKDEDKEEMRTRLSLLPLEEDFAQIFAIGGEVFYKHKNHCYQLYPFEKQQKIEEDYDE